MKRSLLTFLIFCGCQAGIAFAQSPAPDQPPTIDPILAGEDIREARGLVDIARPPQWPLYSAMAAGALALGGLAYWFWLRRSRDTAVTAYEMALAELEAAHALLRTESVERFSIVVSDTLRRYIAIRFGITAPRKTTEEFLKALAGGNDTPLVNYREPLRQFLTACDAAKFARAMLSNDDMLLLITRAREFLEATHDREQPADGRPSSHPNVQPLTV